MKKLKKIENIRIILLFICTVIAGINIGQFQSIDEGNATNYKALNTYNSSNILNIGLNYSQTVRGYFGGQYALSQVAPKSTVLLPKNSRYDGDVTTHRLYSYGDVKKVKRIESIDEEQLFRHIDPSKFIVASNERVREDIPYFAIAMKQEKRGEEMKRIARGLAYNTSVSKPSSEFILLDWSGPDKPLNDEGVILEDSTYILLLETSLLPEGFSITEIDDA